jgi:hypothetical protein
MTKRVDRNGPDWASWSTRRVIGVALLFGVCGGVVGALQALTGHRGLADAVELVALYAALWCVFASCVLLATRALARHPRRQGPPRRR